MTGEVAVDKEPAVAIVTDSASSIPEALREQYRIEVVPYWVNMGADSYRSGIDLLPDAFFQHLRAHPELEISTGVPAISTFLDAYQRQAQWAKHIVSIHLAGKQSATCNTAEIAGRESPVPVTVVDTQTTAMGEGFIVLEAARAAAAGASPETIVEKARAAASNAGVIALLETLRYVFKGGRLSGAMRKVGSLIKVRPLIRVHGNRVSLVGQARRRSKGITALVEKVVAEVSDAPTHLAVHYAEDAAEGARVLEKLKQLVNCVESHLLRVPIELGVHAGPGSIGVAYYAERQPSSFTPPMEKLTEYARGAKNALLARVPWTQKNVESAEDTVDG